MHDYAFSLYNKIKSDGIFNLKDITHEHPDIQYKKLEPQTVNKSLPGIGRSNDLTGALLALDSGKLSKPIHVGNRVVIVKVLSRADIDEDDLRIEQAVLRDRLLKRQGNSFYNSWVNALKENAKIIDNREFMYQ